MDRKTYNRTATKRHIETVLLRLLSEGNHLDQISAAQLCHAAGVAKSTFYLYYQDKYAVLESIAAEYFAKLKSTYIAPGKYSVSDIVSGKPVSLAKGLVVCLSENKEVFRVLFGPTGPADLLKQIKAESDDKFKEMYRAFHMPPRHEHLATAQFFSGTIELVRFYLFENTSYSDEEMTIIFGNMLRNTLMIADHLR